MDAESLATEFFDALHPVVEHAAYVLNKEGAEGLVLQPLGRFPKVAAYAARSMATAPSSYIRCIGCLVPAFTPDCEPDLLWELWQSEIGKRDNPDESIRADLEAAAADPQAFGLPMDPAELGTEPGDGPVERPSIEQQVAMIASMEANSVSERIIISSVKMLERGPEQRQGAWRVLVDMADRALRGENWQDAHFALALLVRSGHPDARAILARCAESDGEGHLATWAAQISAGDKRLLDEPLKLAGPVPKGVKLPKAQQAELNAAIEAAGRLEKAMD